MGIVGTDDGLLAEQRFGEGLGVRSTNEPPNERCYTGTAESTFTVTVMRQNLFPYQLPHYRPTQHSAPVFAAAGDFDLREYSSALR